MASPANSSKEVELDISPYLKVYKDGTVERIFGSPYVPPSFDHPDPTTNVLSKDITISPNVSARIYLPAKTAGKIPILVYYHGGGFCLESAFSFLDHRYINQLAAKSRAIVVSVEYRLAPENPLPAAFEDSWEALKWVASHDPIFRASAETSRNPKYEEPWLISHGDFNKVFVGGDSAGGNIAHNMAMKAGEERRGLKILGAILSFPYFLDQESDEEGVAYKMWRFAYPSSPLGAKDPLINPFGENAATLGDIGCEKVFVCCGEKDDLRKIDLQYAEALKKSGWNGEVEVVDVEGEGHCFQAFDPFTEKAQSLIDSMACFIRG